MIVDLYLNKIVEQKEKAHDKWLTDVCEAGFPDKEIKQDIKKKLPLQFEEDPKIHFSTLGSEAMCFEFNISIGHFFIEWNPSKDDLKELILFLNNHTEIKLKENK